MQAFHQKGQKLSGGQFHKTFTCVIYKTVQLLFESMKTIATLVNQPSSQSIKVIKYLVMLFVTLQFGCCIFFSWGGGGEAQSTCGIYVFKKISITNDGSQFLGNSWLLCLKYCLSKVMVFVNSHPLQGFEGYWECSLQSCLHCTRSNPSVLFKQFRQVHGPAATQALESNGARTNGAGFCECSKIASFFMLPQT